MLISQHAFTFKVQHFVQCHVLLLNTRTIKHKKKCCKKQSQQIPILCAITNYLKSEKVNINNVKTRLPICTNTHNYSEVLLKYQF